MEKTISPFPFIVAGEEEKEEIKLQYPEIWHRETLTLMTRSTRKNLLKNSGSSLPLTPGEMPKEKEGGSVVVDCGGGGDARAGVGQKNV
jgi:hypothetical protein